MSKENFTRRLQKHEQELKWLYMELYGDEDSYGKLISYMGEFEKKRSAELKALDEEREKNPMWYRDSGMLGMTMYPKLFAGGLKGLKKKLDYLSEQKITYLHLMPLLKMPHPYNDGGYAVEDFRQVDGQIGTNQDLEALTKEMRKRGISLCLDLVMNHTADTHQWAMRAKAGEQEYIDRYQCYDTYDIPAQFERTMPQVFPSTAPGNFTWCEEMKKHVLTTFYPYQWDLNYRNPVVFNEMAANILFLANLGVEVLRIDAVPYIWKEIGTNCRNLPQVHTIVRMVRMILEVVCPAVILKGEVVMAPKELPAYFGTPEKPECHMLYGVSSMVNLWGALATRDVRLLKHQMDLIHSLPDNCYFVNYLRCHDDIGWGLDYGALKSEGIGERSHKKYLNDYFQGYTGDSNSRGELYNADPVTGDARFCGTTASMCGVEKAGFEQDEAAMGKAIQMDVMLHAYMFMQSGIPVLYSGDEIGQVNDYTYKEDPDKAPDSRYIHRGAMNWELVGNISKKGTVEEKIFHRLERLEQIRKKEKVFVSNADTWTIDTWDASVLCIARCLEGEKIIGLFNFSEFDKTAWINETDGDYVELISGEEMKPIGVNIPAYGFYYLKRK